MTAGDRKHPYRVGAPAPIRSQGHWAYGLVLPLVIAALAAALFLL
jgi:hypothetical protein